MKNLKQLVGYAAQTAGVLETALIDGFQITDMLPIGLQLAQLPNLNKVLPEAKTEWANRTDAELTELKQHFADNFDISNDELEAKIEKIFAFVTSAADLIGEFSKN